MNLGGSKRVNSSLSVQKNRITSQRQSQLRKPELEERKSALKRSSMKRERSVSKRKKANVFAGVLFFVEVFHDQQSRIQYYQDQVISLGGKISKQLTKQVEYVVFQDGRNKTVQKVILNPDFKETNLVTPQFLEDCANSGKILDHLRYLPENYEQRLQNSEVTFKLDNKKRRDLSSNQDSQSSSQLKSKAKIKPSTKKLTFEQDPLLIESAFEFDKEELDKTIKQIREDHFFQKEFAKDLKRFNKLQQETLNQNQTQENPKKKSVKQMNKDQLINSYIEGEIETLQFLQEMETKMKEKKAGKRRAYQGGGANKRMTEMFRTKKAADQSNQIENEEDQAGLNKSYLNRTGIVSIQDYLVDIDKENSPINTANKPQKNKVFNQTSLIFGQKRSPFIAVCQENNPADLNQPLIGAQIVKSITLPADDQSLVKRVLEEESKTAQKNDGVAKQLDFSFGGAQIITRRAYSLAPAIIYNRSQSQKRPLMHCSKLILDSNLLLNDQSGRVSTHQMVFSRPHTQKKKMVLPPRQIPQRMCKFNVSYQEIEEESMKSDSVKKRKMYNEYFEKVVRKRHLIDL